MLAKIMHSGVQYIVDSVEVTTLHYISMALVENDMVWTVEVTTDHSRMFGIHKMFGHGAAYGEQWREICHQCHHFFFFYQYLCNVAPTVQQSHSCTQPYAHCCTHKCIHTYTTVAPIYAPTCPTTLYALIFAPTWGKSFKCCSNFREHFSFPISAQTKIWNLILSSVCFNKI